MSTTISVPKFALSNREQAILVFLGFLLIAVQGFFQQSPFVAANPTLSIILVLLGPAIIVVKEFAGSTQVGVLPANIQAALMFTAFSLTSLGAFISVQSSNPMFLFFGAFVAAIVAGIKEYAGSQPVKAP